MHVGGATAAYRYSIKAYLPTCADLLYVARCKRAAAVKGCPRTAITGHIQRGWMTPHVLYVTCLQMLVA